MSSRLSQTLGSLTAAALLAVPTFAAPTNGWCHLTPWTAESPAVLGMYGRTVELEDGWAFLENHADATVDAWRRDGGTWTRVQTLACPQGSSGMFGMAIERDGDDLYVSAPSSDLAAPFGGAVFRFALQGNRWTYAQTIVSPNPADQDQFGSALDVDQGWLAVGVVGAGSDGAIDMFREVDGAWVPHARLEYPGSDLLGRTVAVHATADGLSANVFSGDHYAYGITGAVFHFRVHPFGYLLGPALTSPVQGGYGYALDFDGEHLVIGAPWAEQSGVSTGAAYVHDVDGEVFPPSIGPAVTLLPDVQQFDAEFGKRVVVHGERIAVAAPEAFGLDEVTRPGAVSVYRPAFFGNGWQLEDRLLREGGQHWDQLGVGLDLDGTQVVAGGWNGNTGAHGEAVLFSLTSQAMDGGLAPVDVLATVAHYGEGKAGSLGVPLLTTAQPPVPGESSLVVLSHVAQGTVPILFVGFAPAEIPFDGGALLVLDPIALTLPTVTAFEQVGMQWLVPDEVALAGFDLHAQAMLIDPAGSGPKKTAQSRGMKVTFGY